MAGVKRRTKYRKNVAQELEDFIDLEEGERIARVLGSRGGNLFDVESEDGVFSLCRLPTRYRKMVWIKRGSFIVVVQAAEDVEIVNGKGKAKVLFGAKHILMDHQIKYLRQQGRWPERFMSEKELKQAEADAEEAEAEAEAEEEVPAQDKGDAEVDEANKPQVKSLTAAETRAKMLEKYMYEESSSDDDDDDLLHRNRNRMVVDSDSESSSGDSD